MQEENPRLCFLQAQAACLKANVENVEVLYKYFYWTDNLAYISEQEYEYLELTKDFKGYLENLKSLGLFWAQNKTNEELLKDLDKDYYLRSFIRSAQLAHPLVLASSRLPLKSLPWQGRQVQAEKNLSYLQYLKPFFAEGLLQALDEAGGIGHLRAKAATALEALRVKGLYRTFGNAPDSPLEDFHCVVANIEAEVPAVLAPWDSYIPKPLRA